MKGISLIQPVFRSNMNYCSQPVLYSKPVSTVENYQPEVISVPIEKAKTTSSFSKIKQGFVSTQDWLNAMQNLQSKVLYQNPTVNNHLFQKGNVARFVAPSTREVERNKKIDKESEHLAHPIKDRTEYNTKQLIFAGVKSRDVKKYLKVDGHVTEEGKRILREHGRNYK